MLFNSYVFIFAFLPVTLAIYYALAQRSSKRMSLTWLVAASIFFYGWYRPENLLLLGILLVATYGVGIYLSRHCGTARGRIVLGLGIAANLVVLGYFKYANFVVETVNALTPLQWQLQEVVLPLGISFFIFQKIAYLVDAYRGKAHGYNFTDYCLFVTFFPQLIAGPIVHHAEVVPQFTHSRKVRSIAEDLAVGGSLLIVGLVKKVILADTFAQSCSPVFHTVSFGTSPSMADAWIAALAYTLQLYFDFSGYSDMALGLGRMFGINLPMNFNSPYQARNISDFWRRWHMTLSRFLRDYLYIPLGGNRCGKTRRYVNLMLTMLLGGLWHGAGWTFIFWGGLHGAYLVIHQWWAGFRKSAQTDASDSRLSVFASRGLTFLAVVVAWVFFRASNFETAGRMLGAMFGFNGIGGSLDERTLSDGALITVGLLVVWFAPNSVRLFARYQPAIDSDSVLGTEAAPRRWQWQPSAAWACVLVALGLTCVLMMSRISEFIYWQF